MLPLRVFQVPEWGATAKFQDVTFNECAQFLAYGGQSTSVAHQCLKVTDDLGGVEVGDFKALGMMGCGHQVSGHAGLDATLWEGSKEDRGHDLGGLGMGQGGGHQWVLQGFIWNLANMFHIFSGKKKLL